MTDYLAFLVDENLTPVLAEMAQERGYQAMHATWVRLGGRKDHQVASYAINNNMILVTNDLSDFRRIYKRRKLHPGIVFLAVMDSGIMDRDAQTLMFEAALENSILKSEQLYWNQFWRFRCLSVRRLSAR